MTWTTRMRIAVDVARGISFLHSLDANVIYRDLKASNILLDSVHHQQIPLISINHLNSFRCLATFSI